jgi:hypothetical protein
MKMMVDPQNSATAWAMSEEDWSRVVICMAIVRLSAWDIKASGLYNK